MADFFLALCAVTLVAITSRNKALIATSVLLLANWVVNSAICAATGEDYPYLAFMLTDYLTGLTTVLFVSMWLQSRPTRWQVIVTIVFSAQVLWHIRFMWSDQGQLMRYLSWHFLSKTAWAQLMFVGAWCVVTLYNNILRSDGFISSDQGVCDSFTEAQESR